MTGIALSIRHDNGGSFKVTPMDFLVVTAVLALAVLASKGIVDSGIKAVVLKTIILFYGAELILGRMKQRWNIFTVSVLVSLLVTGVRGSFVNFL